jgi:hypothetical protein
VSLLVVSTGRGGTVAYTGYVEARKRLVENKPFEGNSMSAFIRPWENDPQASKNVYVVYSYDRIIYKEVDGRCVYWDNRYYSTTTSKHQSYVGCAKRDQIEKLTGLQAKNARLVWGK